MQTLRSEIKILPALFLFICTLASAKPQWPLVREFDKTLQFSEENSAGFDVPIVGENGRQLYELKCHSADYDGDADFDYSGVVDCRLISKYTKDSVSTLFAEDENQSSDWENRGRFLIEHLLPNCASYSDWGAERAFRLRGMKIVLKANNIKFIDQAKKLSLRGFELEVSVRNAHEIINPIAQPSPIKEPRWFYHPNEDECR